MNPMPAASRRSLALAILWFALVPVAARAEVARDLPLFSQNIPTIPKEIGIDQKLGEKLPMDLKFVDDTGKPVVLGDYFRDGKPVLLNLVYFECPALCSLALNGEVTALRAVDLKPGEDFRIVTVSFSPTETPQLAARKKANYILSLGSPEPESQELAEARKKAARDGAASLTQGQKGLIAKADAAAALIKARADVAAGGWAFLTGEQKDILALAKAAGFRYQYNPVSKQYEHDAALMIVTPDGRLSRYLPSVVYDAKVLRLSTIEASGGKIGTVADQIFLACFKYDASKSAYVPMAMRIMQAGGAATVVVLAMTLAFLWLIENKKKKLNHVEPNPA